MDPPGSVLFVFYKYPPPLNEKLSDQFLDHLISQILQCILGYILFKQLYKFLFGNNGKRIAVADEFMSQG